MFALVYASLLSQQCLITGNNDIYFATVKAGLYKNNIYLMLGDKLAPRCLLRRVTHFSTVVWVDDIVDTLNFNTNFINMEKFKSKRFKR